MPSSYRHHAWRAVYAASLLPLCAGEPQSIGGAVGGTLGGLALGALLGALFVVWHFGKADKGRVAPIQVQPVQPQEHPRAAATKSSGMKGPARGRPGSQMGGRSEGGSFYREATPPGPGNRPDDTMYPQTGHVSGDAVLDSSFASAGRESVRRCERAHRFVCLYVCVCVCVCVYGSRVAVGASRTV